MHDEEHGVYLFGEEHDEEVMEVEGRCVGLPQGKYVYLVFHGTDKHETYFFKQQLSYPKHLRAIGADGVIQVLMVPGLGQIVGFSFGNASVDVMQ